MIERPGGTTLVAGAANPAVGRGDDDAVDVAAFIDARKPGRFQYGVLLLCMAVLFMDGYDTQVIGYLGPSLVSAFKVPPADLRPVFLVALVGLMIGGAVCGPLADRFGRRRFVILSTLAFGLLSLATAWSWSVESMTVLRFLTGLGLGGAMPNTVALGIEYFPRARRAFVTAGIWVGFSIGAVIAGFAAAVAIKAGGWPAAFAVGGVFPIALAVLLAVMLPESLRFLVLKGGRRAEIAALLVRVAPDERSRFAVPERLRFVSSEEAGRGQPVAALFRDGRASGTIILWIVTFLALAVTFLMTSWLPITFNQGGMDQSASILALTMYQVGSVIGVLTIGRLMDRFDRFLLLAGAFAISSVLVLTLGLISHRVPVWALLLIMVVNGIFNSAGGTQGVNALTGTYYPTAMRSTGIGWALGLGRFGSLAGIWLGGALIAAHWSVQGIFLSVTASAIVCAGLVLMLRQVTLRRPDRRFPVLEPRQVA